MTKESTNPLLARDERIAKLEAELATAKIDIQYVDHDFALTKAAHVKCVDELVALRADHETTLSLLRCAESTLAHLEHGLKEQRRIAQNIIEQALIERVRKETA